MAESKSVKETKELDPNELVPYTPFYDGHTYKDDVIVGINGKRWQLERGKQHMIPRYVYNAIMEDERERAQVNELRRAQQEAFAKSNI
jgi:pullulanase/glycogen debranching enzyme